MEDKYRQSSNIKHTQVLCFLFWSHDLGTFKIFKKHLKNANTIKDMLIFVVIVML